MRLRLVPEDTSRERTGVLTLHRLKVFRSSPTKGTVRLARSSGMVLTSLGVYPERTQGIFGQGKSHDAKQTSHQEEQFLELDHRNATARDQSAEEK
ncbi:hypothetical protein HYALB_00010943 [Hymenoscyphus albidus]|uniref:Uncharacterized protein n=1 Tax=Hymenoscyphus albidus TaxID=595503 RepID=A0A9N9LQS9_9HELO|nr:hypothetical protein HYALB_00010943 [Hymenoscyphus albidus]